MGKLKDTGYGFMRKGQIGDWKNYFSEENLRLFEAKYGFLMDRLGYERFSK
jgi:hypothetical protein